MVPREHRSPQRYFHEGLHYFCAGTKLFLAQAIIVDSPVSRLIGSFFLGLNKPPFPTKLFTSEADAVEWLKGYLQ